MCQTLAVSTLYCNRDHCIPSSLHSCICSSSESVGFTNYAGPTVFAYLRERKQREVLERPKLIRGCDWSCSCHRARRVHGNQSHRASSSSLTISRISQLQKHQSSTTNHEKTNFHHGNPQSTTRQGYKSGR